MPPRNDDWKIQEFDRRTVESLDILRKEVEELKLWQAGIKVKVAFFSCLFGVAGTVATHFLLSWLKLK